MFVQSKKIVTAKLIISNTQMRVTAIKTMPFILLAMRLVGSVLMVNIDVTLDEKVGEELFLKIKERSKHSYYFRNKR